MFNILDILIKIIINNKIKWRWSILIEYKKIYRIFLVITLFTVGMNSIDNNYIYAQDKNIYQNELEADNQNKQKYRYEK